MLHQKLQTSFHIQVLLAECTSTLWYCGCNSKPRPRKEEGRKAKCGAGGPVDRWTGGPVGGMVEGCKLKKAGRIEGTGHARLKKVGRIEKEHTRSIISAARAEPRQANRPRQGLA